jgi:hypothetical protein
MVPGLGGAFCSAERAGDWQQFVTAHAEKLPGYERNLAQAVESIRLCAALKSAQAAKLVAAFADYIGQTHRIIGTDTTMIRISSGRPMRQ